MPELSGWMLDVYPDQEAGVLVWLLGDDGQRHRLRQPLPITFYAAGPAERLRALWRYLDDLPAPPKLWRCERRELFSRDPLPVLAAQVQETAHQPRLFHQVNGAFPDLTFFDADVPLPLRYAAAHGVFPLARCQVDVDHEKNIQDIQVLDSPWDLEPPAPPLRILWIEPDANPNREQTKHLLLRAAQHQQSADVSYRLAMAPERPLLVNLRAILERHDPDLLLSAWGDTWLLPHLLRSSRRLRLPLPLSRDSFRQAAHRPERTYFSYGQVVYRGRQVLLFGRWHIDRGNAMLWGDYDLEGILESARVTGLPVQTAARVSPGTGISAMQMLTALRTGILVPWHKQQVESPKSALEMFAADQGGLVYQPLVGLHNDVAEIDFVSMYPGVMVRFNISPETVGGRRPPAQDLTKIEAPDGNEELGLVPQTLAPLLDKRLALKGQLANMSRWDRRYGSYKARASAHKWLLVTCFGYLGYKNARFGRIEAHEAVTAYGREALLRAKDTAEDLGFTVLHLYVDGLWVKKSGASAVADFQPLLEAISERTSLPISLEGIYRWVAFLPSRVDARLPVPNRYFGAYQDGSLKVRGIEARRGDAPDFIAETQMLILELLAKEHPPGAPNPNLPKALALLRRRLGDLRAGKVPLERLVINQRLSRELDEYRVPSPGARAAYQMQALGRRFRAGQRVHFLYTRGKPGVHAWDHPEALNPAALDIERYTTLLLRAAHTVLAPFGMGESSLRLRVGETPARQLTLKNPKHLLPAFSRSVKDIHTIQ